MTPTLFQSLRQLAHPILVHFPIALLFASVGLDWLGFLTQRPGFTRAGFYTLVLGALGAGVAALAGPDHVGGDAAALLAWHQFYALLTVALAVALVASRFFPIDGLTGRWALLYLAATLVLLFFVCATGYFGGEMTYHQGVGVTVNGVPSAPDTGEGFAAVQGAPHIPAKPFVVLLGFLSVVVVGIWLLAGRSLAPGYYTSWWRAVRAAGEDGSGLWTLRQRASCRIADIADSDIEGIRERPTLPSYGPRG